MNWIPVDEDPSRLNDSGNDEGQASEQRDPPLAAEQLCLHKWERLVEDYTQRQLTYTSDTFMAISSLVQRIGQTAGWRDADYLAGHWCQGLP
jgi:hypothetical protein